MDDRTVPTTDEAKRLTETMRKREYRAGKRDEFFELLVESRRLTSNLAQLKAKVRIEQLQRLIAKNASLRASGTRKQGLQWLSERIYHEACLVLPETTLYRGKDGPTIAAMETIYQHTISTNFEIVARYYWENATGDAAPVPWTLIDKVDNGRFMYLHHTNARVGTNALAIAGLFIEANRAVITNCFVAKDELLPLGEGLQRPHGMVHRLAVSPPVILS
ncbi:unnamed protein product [Aphanomyces euteiches]